MARIISRLLGSTVARKAYSAVRKVPILGTGLAATVHRFIPPRQRLWVTIPSGISRGMWVYLDPVADQAGFHGDHEPWIQDLLSSWIKPGFLFYDVGAHIGTFSFGVSRLVGASGHVYAFEPDPENAQCLRAGIERNHLGHCLTVVGAAVSDRDGSIDFLADYPSYLSRVVRNSELDGGSGEGDEDKKRFRVNAVMLDRYFKNRPCVVKVDVEGAEGLVLEGARRFIESRATYWIVETHDQSLTDQVASQLRDAEYHVQVTRPRHPRDKHYAQTYVVAVPQAN